MWGLGKPSLVIELMAVSARVSIRDPGIIREFSKRNVLQLNSSTWRPKTWICHKQLGNAFLYTEGQKITFLKS